MAELLVVGTLHTMDAKRPKAQAALVRDGRFVKVGTRAECEAMAGEQLLFIELGEGCAVPGLIDAHGHPALHGRMLEEVRLGDCKSEQECVERVAMRAQIVPAGEWIRGAGWDQNAWARREFPRRELLDAATLGHPVVLTRVDVHAVWCNGAALAQAGITRTTADPPGGRIIKSPDGEPSGVLVDAAMELVLRAIPPRTGDLLETDLLRSLRSLATMGVTAVHDAAAGAETLAAYRRLAKADRLPLRVYAMIDGRENLDEQIPLALNEPELPNLTVRAVKLFADGALGSRGAMLSEPYSDAPNERGLWLTDPRALEEDVRHIVSAGLQPCIHCIGDEACAVVLRLLALVPKALRPRAEHLQLLKARDIPLLKKSGAIASMQPMHAVSDGAWAHERLGKDSERLRGAYAWRQALDAGAVLAFGSDFPVESADPRLGLAAAAGRKLASGQVWMPEQRISREEALRAYTAGAAFAEFAEQRRGQIREGFDADFTVFGADILSVHVDQLASVEVLATIVAGQVIFAA